MRTKERWLIYFRTHRIQKLFPPRLQQDLRTLPMPKKLPDIGTGLFLLGPTGSGKTVLSGFLLLQYSLDCYLHSIPERSAFVSVPELFQQIKDTFQPDSKQSERQVLDRYYNVDLLVLDDFGVTRPSDWVLQTTYAMVNYRYEHLKPTIFTSNFTLDEISELYNDDRITSRIERMCRILKIDR